MLKHTNTENEVISIQELGPGLFEGQHVLVIHDDPPPLGSGIEAPMLLDMGTIHWLQRQLKIVEQQLLLRDCTESKCREYHREQIRNLQQE